MEPDSRPNLSPNRWSTNKRVKARTSEFLGAPVLRAEGPKVVRPEPNAPRPVGPTQGEVLLHGLLTIERNKAAAISKLAKRGYRTQTESEFLKLRWPKKPLV